MKFWELYHIAQDASHALRLLHEAPGSSSFIAGGTDLLLDLQQGRHPPLHTLVDVSRINEMTCLEIRQGHLFIGAAVPLNQIISSELVEEHAQALLQACSLIGGPQVRNTATLGGNVAHALPAADGTIALIALDAQAEIAGLQGRKLVPMRELFLGPGHSVLDEHKELLIGFYLPLAQLASYSSFRRVMRPQGVAIAILNMATWIKTEGGRVKDVRIAVGPAGPTPFRAYATEESLRGSTLSVGDIQNARKVLLKEAHFRTSPHRATKEYRHHLVGVLLQETLAQSWESARSV